MAKNGRRDLEAVLGARYQLTDAGMAATDAHWAEGLRRVVLA